MVAIPEFYDKAGDRARRFEVEDLASHDVSTEGELRRAA